VALLACLPSFLARPAREAHPVGAQDA
jgi:hypothetical protein